MTRLLIKQAGFININRENKVMKSLLESLRIKEAVLAVVGLGYVGVPLAVAYGEKFSVIGYDINKEKIEKYRQGIDPTGELEEGALASTEIKFTSDPRHLSEATFIIIAVPTPINKDKTPDLEPLKMASKTVGRYLSQGCIVVYESTVYPGVTEEICCPILEDESGLVCGKDFKIGYSPERINPGDKVHRLKNITKIVSGIDEETLEVIASVYGTIIEHIYRAPSVRIAETAKLVENSQRDINIAFMNEFAMVCHSMDIDTSEVVKAMNTKWNALGFQPGLVGGHCIGVDPYYFIYKAQNLGYYSQMISTGRRINNGMSDFVIQETMRMMVRAQLNVSNSKIYLMGMTFKENCSDTRNSRAIDIYRKMKEYGLRVYASDPLLNSAVFFQQYEISLVGMQDIHDADCMIFLVAHDEFKNIYVGDLIERFSMKSDGKRVIMDVKHILSRDEIEKTGFVYWSL